MGRNKKGVAEVINKIENENEKQVIEEKFNELKLEKKEDAINNKSTYIKKKEKIKIEAAEQMELLKGVGSSFLSLIVPRLPNPIPITEDEKNIFDTAFCKLAAKYIPMTGGYEIEISFVMVSLMIFAPRIKKEKNVLDLSEKPTE